MKAIATSLFAALALAGGVAHADPSTFGDPDNVPFQGVYAPPRAVVSVAPRLLATSDVTRFVIASGDGSDDDGQVLLADDGGSDDNGQILLADSGGSDDSGQTLLASGGGSDNAGQTLLADGGGSDDSGPTLLAIGPDDGSTQLA